MADELRLQIVLEDGSVKEGFLKLEKQADQTSKKVGKSLEKSGVKEFANQADNLTDVLNSAQGGFANLASTLARSIGPTGTFAIAAAAAATATVKLALAGEQVNAVNAQFENIARSSGLAVDSFKQSIIGATQGLIDDEDALQIATKGIIALGDAAKNLPQILEASRAVSKTLGKDFKDTFQDLSSFVENGNARVLRQFGIVLDLDKAYKDAAKSIGVATSELTEQQKQIVRTNLVLDEVPKKFRAGADSVTPIKDAIDRLIVSSSNFFETISSGFANSFTKTFLDATDLSNVGISRLNNSLIDNKKRLEEINPIIDQYLSKQSRNLLESIELNKLLKERGTLLQDNAKSLVEASGRSDQELFSQLESSRTPQEKQAIVITPEQAKLARESELKRLNELQSYVSAQDKLVLDSEIKRLQTITDLDSKLIAQKSIFSQQSILLEQQKNAALSQIDTQFSSEKGFSETQREQARLATIQNFYLQEQALAKQNADAIKLIEENKNFSVLSGFQNMSMGFMDAATDFSNNAVANFKEVGKQAFNSLGRGVGQAFAAFGQALANGEDAGQAFLQSMLGLFADVAIQLGTSFIMQGIAHSLNPLTPGLGGPLITAGAALATFGGILKAMSGGKSSTTQQDTGGGIASSPSSTTELTPQENLTRQEVGTSVQVTIQGDVLDSDESGSRIVNLINQAFDKKGVVINQGVTA